LQGLTPLTATTASLQLNTTSGIITGMPTTGTLSLQYDETPDSTLPFQIVTGTRLRIGAGLNAEWVQVTGVTGFDPLTGIGTVTVLRDTGLTDGVAVLQRSLANETPPVPLPVHPVGSLITNVQLGNPGPQPNFDPSQPNYKAVMPYVQRLED